MRLRILAVQWLAVGTEYESTLVLRLQSQSNDAAVRVPTALSLSFHYEHRLRYRHEGVRRVLYRTARMERFREAECRVGQSDRTGRGLLQPVLYQFQEHLRLSLTVRPYDLVSLPVRRTPLFLSTLHIHYFAS